MLRLYDPNSGQLLLDGTPLSQLAPAAVRRELAVVAADGAIFQGTLLDNIRYQRPTATIAEVMTAATAAGLASTLARLPDGLESEVGERGVGLSVGERQRLQLARALVTQPRVLILDEATANLDYATETDIRRAIFAPGPHPTTLVIAHRYSMVENADHVIVLDGGAVQDQGRVVDLIRRGGWFAGFAASGAVSRADITTSPAVSTHIEDDLDGDDE
jgi:ABC-type multidrug transport system fused ATPase/permease subunit